MVLRVRGEFDTIRPSAIVAVKFELEGLAKLVRDNPFARIEGTAAIWIRAKEQEGTFQLTETHKLSAFNA